MYVPPNLVEINGEYYVQPCKMRRTDEHGELESPGDVISNGGRVSKSQTQKWHGELNDREGGR